MFLNEIEAKQMLKSAGIIVAETLLARSKEEAVNLSKQVSFPVVLKIVSPDIIHKSDAGGVKVGLKTVAEVEAAYDGIMSNVAAKCPGAKITGIAVQHMAPSGTEVIIGMTKDPQFGSALMFGLGGIFVELLKDVSFRVTPISQLDAAEMVREIKGFQLLNGFRGQPAVDIAAIEQMLLQVSKFVEANPQIKELDLNPVLAYPDGVIAVDARINIEEPAPETGVHIAGNTKLGKIDSLFYPKTVAVVGASNNPLTHGHGFIKNMVDYGFKGSIYPITPKYNNVLGIKAYPNIESVPENVDHVIFCIDLANLPDLMDQFKNKGVRSIHVFAARGAETGRADAKELEVKVKAKANEYGIRILGPNCMGVYCPESGFSFIEDAPKDKGGVGAIVQSGGSSADITRYAALRGLRFSKLVSYGNALDINEMDLLKYMCDDPETKVIIAFIEGLRGNGRDFLELVRQTSAKKPFIVLKGGLSKAGARATMSHTASLAGSSKIWETAIRQAGGIPVRDLDELVHMAVAFSYLPRIKGKRVGTGGSGGGRNTISVDQWETNGFEVVPLPQEIREEFKRRGSILWDVIDNPADASIIIPGDAYNVTDLMTEMAKNPAYDFICGNVAVDDYVYNKESFPDYVGKKVEDYIKLHKESPKPFFVIFIGRPFGIKEMDYWLWREAAKLRTQMVEAKVPFFPHVNIAAQAIKELIWYYDKKEKVEKAGKNSSQIRSAGLSSGLYGGKYSQ